MEITTVRIAILGKRTIGDWKATLLFEIQEWFAKLGDKEPLFYMPVSPSRVECFPDGMDRYMEAIYAQERLMASRSDIVVYANDGSWDSNGNKQRHLKKLFDVAPIVMVWTPPESTEEVLTPEDPIQSGAVNVYGDKSIVASLIAYIAMAEIVT